MPPRKNMAQSRNNVYFIAIVRKEKHKTSDIPSSSTCLYKRIALAILWQYSNKQYMNVDKDDHKELQLVNIQPRHQT